MSKQHIRREWPPEGAEWEWLSVLGSRQERRGPGGAAAAVHTSPSARSSFLPCPCMALTKMGEEDQKAEMSGYGINEPRGCNVQHGDQLTILYFICESC